MDRNALQKGTEILRKITSAQEKVNACIEALTFFRADPLGRPPYILSDAPRADFFIEVPDKFIEDIIKQSQAYHEKALFDLEQEFKNL